MLTTRQIDGLKPQDRQYKVADADGLYLVVSPRNVKSWRFNYRVDGKYQTKTYGRYPEISLAKARLLNSEFKDWLASGGGAAPTFLEMAREWWAIKEKAFKNVKHRLLVWNRIQSYILPKIGARKIDELRRTDFVEVVKAVDAKGLLETAHRVALSVREVMDYAVDCGRIESHAAGNLSRVLRPPVKVHMKCIDASEAGELFRAIKVYDEPITRIGLLLLANTFVRTTELRLMRWDEIQNDKFWVIPAHRMKMNKPHVVPLSRQVMALLDEVKIYSGESDLVLDSPARTGYPISENTLLFALYRLGFRGRMTGHGFRSLASTVLNQQSPFAGDVIERQLAHKESDAIRAAYNRAEYLDERVKMMQWYSDWIEGVALPP